MIFYFNSDTFKSINQGEVFVTSLQ